MKAIIGAAAVICLGCATSVLAQEPQALENSRHYTITAQKVSQEQRIEIVEAANPFLSADDGSAPRSLTFQDRSAQMQLGDYDRPDVAEAPVPAFIRRGKDAVGLAVSLKLGG